MTYAYSAPAAARPWTLAHRPEAADQARQIAKECLTRWRVTDEVTDSVLLTVSELVTNAVQHAQPPLTVGLDCDPTVGYVHIEVSDGGPAAPGDDLQSSLPDDEHGRGLMIVECLTAGHGKRQEPGHAVHWADISTAA
ncbi:ATP-binding protein [Streptomyces sp. NPDC050743]|uniref:ATP-binding protein n=1 Tax=Streptomyces sp. NPDC050743 TaxID=3365634 RepID=UPI0037A98357